MLLLRSRSWLRPEGRGQPLPPPGLAQQTTAAPLLDVFPGLWVEEAFVRDLLESAVLQQVEDWCQPMCGLRPKQG